MHCGFSRWKLLLGRVCVIRIKPLCVPNKDYHQNVWDNAASQIHYSLDLLRADPPRPHPLFVPLHPRKLHLPLVTTLPPYQLRTRSYLLGNNPPFRPVLQKSLHYALKILLTLVARVHRHEYSSSLSRALQPKPRLHHGNLHDRPRPRPRPEVFPPPRRRKNR